MYAHRFELVTASVRDEIPVLTMSLTMGFDGLLIDGEDVSGFARVVKVAMRTDLALDDEGNADTDTAVIIATLWVNRDALAIEPIGVNTDGSLAERFLVGKHELLTPPNPAKDGPAGGMFVDAFLGELVIRPTEIGSMI